MNNPHTYYQPTEYEEMMIAAGWVTLADLDDDYQKCPRAHGDEYMSYEGWVSMKREWDALNAEYEAWITPFYTGIFHDVPMPRPLQVLQSDLLSRMSYIETVLGY